MPLEIIPVSRTSLQLEEKLLHPKRFPIGSPHGGLRVFGYALDPSKAAQLRSLAPRGLFPPFKIHS